jgi:tetratricopeptide (TPR) repeat protein
MSYYCKFGLITVAALYIVPLSTVESAYEPTEFLARWDRRYRLIDPDVEPRSRGEECDYAAAAAELKDGVVTGIPDEEMYYRLGFCYEKLGDYDRAVEAYSSAATALVGKSAGGPLEYYIPYHMGIANARRGRYIEAANAFKKALRFPQVSAAAHNSLGYCYNRLSLKRKALEEFKNAAALDPRLAEAFLNMGNTQAELGDLPGAAASLQSAVRLQPDIPGGSYSLGLVQRASGEDAEAERSFKAAIESVPEDAKAHLALARLYFDSGRTVAAREEAHIALGLSPAVQGDDPDLFRALGAETAGVRPENRAGGYDEAVLLDRAQSLSAQGNFSEAEKLYASILGGNPRCIQACLGMAYLNEFVGGVRYGEGFPAAKSISFYKRALAIQPQLSAAWFNLGNVYEKRGMFVKAVEAFTKAKELSPGMQLASYNLGVCYGMLGEKGKAKEQFLETLRVDPGFAPAYFQCGVIYSAERDYERAIGAYENALRLDPRDRDSHFNLAQIYKNQASAPLKAVEHFRAYLAIDPDAKDAPRVREWIEELER